MTTEAIPLGMEYELTVDHMCCEHCETTITDAVEDLEGVTAVDAESETNTVTVTGTQETKQQVRETIETAGFTVKA